MKTRNKFLLAGGALLLALLAAPLVLTLALDQAYYKQKISDAVESATGRPLVIAGDLEWAFGFTPAIQAQAVRYPNAAWGSQPWAVEVESAEFKLDLSQLLRGQLQVADVVLRGLKLHIERDADGVYNLARERAAGQTNATALPLWLNIAGVDIIGGDLSVRTRNRRWDLHIARGEARSAGRDQPVTLVARGALEEVPIAASATLGDPATLFAQLPSALSVTGWVGDETNRISAAGSARNLLRWRGVDLQLEYRVAQLPALSKLFVVELPAVAPFAGRAEYHQPARLFSMQLREVEARAVQFGLRTTVTGRVPKLYRLADLDLRVTAEGVLAHPLADWAARHGAPGDLKTRIAGTLRGSPRDLDLAVESASAENAHIFARTTAAGAFNRKQKTWRGQLPVELTVKDAAALAEIDAFGNLGESAKRAFAELAPATAAARLIRDAKSWHLRGIQLALEQDEINLTVAGEIDDLTGEVAGRFKVRAAAADGEFLRAWLAQPSLPLAEIEDIEIAGEIAFARDDWRATLARAAAKARGVELTAAGSIGDLRKWRGVDLMVTAAAEDLSRLPAGGALAALGAAAARARLADDAGGAFHLTDLSASTLAVAAAGAESAPVAARAQGEIRHLGAELQADIDLDVQLNSPQPLATRWPALADSDLAPLLAMALPLRASGKLVSSAADAWGIHNLTAVPSAVSAPAKIDAVLTGEVTALQPPSARLHFALGGLKLADLPAAWKIPRPRDGELNAALDLVAADGAWGVENLRAEIANSAAVGLSAGGAIARIEPLKIDALEIKFAAPDWSALNWTDSPFAPDLPIAGRATITTGATAGGDSRRANFAAQVGASDARGVIEWRPPNALRKVPRVDAQLESAQLNLRELFGKRPKRERLFSTAPINAAWIHRVEGDITLAADAVATGQFDLRDAAVTMSLSRGELRQRITAAMGDGAVAADFRIDANSRPLKMDLAVDGARLDTAGLAAFRKDDFLHGGTFDLKVELESHGASRADLAAGAGGSMEFALNRAKMKNQSLDIIGGDIFSNLVTVVNPFRSIGEHIDIECAVLNLDVAGGVATIRDNLAVKTDRVTLSGGGHLNLGDESLKILILPRARKGFGINTASLAKVVRLGGTLAAPKIEADTSRLPQTIAAWTAAFYSAGWSLIAQGLFDRVQANTDVCGLNGDGGAAESDGDASGDKAE